MKPIRFVAIIVLALISCSYAYGQDLKRKNLKDLTEGEVRFIRLGIMQMRLLELKNPNSWYYQANVHGYPKEGGVNVPCTEQDVTDDICEQRKDKIPTTAGCPVLYESEFYDGYPQSEIWNSCQHGNFYFLPWHRLHLYHFEQILRTQASAAIDTLRNMDVPANNKADVEAFLATLTDEVLESTGVPYWDYSNEGNKYEITGKPWSEDDAKMPAILSSGTSCSDGNEGTPASSILDVALEKCNPLRVSNDHRSPTCNDPTQICITGTVPDMGSPFGYSWRADARPALNLTCSYVCDGDDCPSSSCATDTTTHQSFHGKQMPDTTAHTAHSVHNVGTYEGALESTPHSWIHNALGILNGVEATPTSTGFMTLNACSGRDPAFYFHHTNIDRLWQVWLNMGDRQDPIDTEEWKTAEFYFINTDSTQSDLNSPCQVVDMTKLNYGYYYTDAADGSLKKMAIDNVQFCHQPKNRPKRTR